MARLFELALTQIAAERPVAEIATEPAFLIGPGADIDADLAALQAAREFQPVEHAERPVETTSIRLRFDVRADQCQPLHRTVAEHVADAVDARIEPASRSLSRSQRRACMSLRDKVGR